jgi:hypothetical protein
MPIIPTPPPMTLAQRLQTIQQISGNISNPNIYQQAILDAAEVKRIALEQAQKAIEEYMKMEQEKTKQTILTIQNIDKIIGQDYNDSLRVAGVKESDTHYEFTLIYAHHNTIETILLHRRRTSDERYIMEYQGQTLWVSKDRLSTIDGILECMREV